jgi:hypothetical protein
MGVVRLVQRELAEELHAGVVRVARRMADEVLQQERLRRGTDRRAGSARPASRRAFSKSGVMTAFKRGFSFSMRAIAASTSSRGLARRVRTSSAWAVASRSARSDVGLVAHRGGRYAKRAAEVHHRVDGRSGSSPREGHLAR